VNIKTQLEELSIANDVISEVWHS